MLQSCLEGFSRFSDVQKQLPLSRSKQQGVNAPRFGCRLEGGMLSTHTKLLDRDLFVKNMANALPQLAKAQKNLRHSVNPTASLLQNEQAHGWGLSFFSREPNALQHVTSPHNVATDWGYKKAVLDLKHGQVTSGLTHVRVATDVNGPRAENTHPFKLSLDDATWTFVHNGRWNQSLTDAVKNQLADDEQFKPKGDTDSEHAFLFLMRSIRQQLGTVNSKVTGPEAMKQAFAKGIRQLNQESATPFYAQLPESDLGISGEIKLGPSHNFIANDGNLMLAYKNGQSLYLGVQLGTDGKPVGHAIASVPRTAPNLIWFDLQDDTIVSIQRDAKTGQSKAEIMPLARIAPKS